MCALALRLMLNTRACTTPQHHTRDDLLFYRCVNLQTRERRVKRLHIRQLSRCWVRARAQYNEAKRQTTDEFCAFCTAIDSLSRCWSTRPATAIATKTRRQLRIQTRCASQPLVDGIWHNRATCCARPFAGVQLSELQLYTSKHAHTQHRA